MRVLAAVALIAVTTMMLPATIGAQQSDERRRCFASEGMTSQQKLESCTAVIESGGQTSPGLVAAFNSRGNAHLGNRNYDRAIDDYNETIRRDPKYAIGFNNRGLAYQRKGQTDRAIEDFDEAIRLNPTYALAFVNRADARRIKGRIDLAIEDSDRAIGLNRGLASAFFARADAYRDKAQWDFDAHLADGAYEDRAIADYDEGIRLNPNNAAAFRNRGFVNSRRQRYDRAIQDFDEAIRLDPNVAASFSGRAYALRFVGQYERAIADYRKALTLQLDDANRSQIGKILKQLGVGTERDATPTAVTKR
jgi:tetratricopeptide (TPR) repeat protein